MTSAGGVMRAAVVAAMVLLASGATSRCLGDSVQYTVFDLGNLGTNNAGVFAGGINDAGQVAGYYGYGGGWWRAFCTAPNSLFNAATDNLGTLGGTLSQAVGVNSSGQVVGSSYTAGNSSVHAFRTAPNSPINPATDDLGSLYGGGSIGYGINNSGQVVGSSDAYAFRTAPNSPINPATDNLGAGYGSEARAINASGQVAGTMVVAGGNHAFRTAPNGPITYLDDLGTLGGHYSQASGINDSGQVIGTSSIAGDDNISHAFLTAPNSPINPATDDLGTLDGETCSVASGINNLGQVVGTSGVAFIYENGVMTDLNDLIAPMPDWVLTNAVAINDSGQVLVWASHQDLPNHIFILTPTGAGIPEPAPVPEPASVVCGLIGLGMIGRYIKKHRST